MFVCFFFTLLILFEGEKTTNKTKQNKTKKLRYMFCHAFNYLKKNIVAFVDSFLGFCHAWVILVFNYLKNVVTSADLFTFGNSKLCTSQFSTLTPAGFGSVFLVPLQFSLCKFLDRIWRFTSYWRWGSMDKATVHVCGYGRVNMLGIVLFFFLFLFFMILSVVKW
jgi:hypothetical protein